MGVSDAYLLARSVGGGVQVRLAVTDCCRHSCDCDMHVHLLLRDNQGYFAHSGRQMDRRVEYIRLLLSIFTL